MQKMTTNIFVLVFIFIYLKMDMASEVIESPPIKCMAMSASG